MGHINRLSLQHHWIGIAIVQGEGDVGAKNGLCFSKDLLARGKDSDALARCASLGLIAFCIVNPVPASTECPEAKSRFANLEELLVDTQSYLRW